LSTSPVQKRKLFDSINTKIIFVIILSILPLNLLVIASTAKSIDVIKEQARIFMENTASLYMQKLDNRISSINYFFYDLYGHDADFIRLTELSGDDEYAISQTAVAQKFRKHIETSDSADGYFFQTKEIRDSIFVMPGSRLILDSAIAYTARSMLEVRLTQTDLSRLGMWNLAVIGGRQWLLRIYSYDTCSFGAVISMEEVCRNVMESIEYSGLKVDVRMGQPGEIADGDLRVSSVSNRIDLTLSLSVPASEVIQNLPWLNRFMIGMAFLYVLLIPMLILSLNRILLRPLRIIRSALLHLKAGNQDYRIIIHNYSKEFRSIDQSFNEMADNIERLKIENYEKEMARQKTEHHNLQLQHRNLQLQIHPHFLLNMFKLIHSLAQTREYASVQKLALYLSNYFRYIFRSGKELETFEQEYDLIRQYLEVSAIRYPDRFTINYNIEAPVMKVKVPPLIIHSFIENIIHHALVADGIVHIHLSASYKDGWVTFFVSDDGVGMDSVTATNINDGILASNDGILASKEDEQTHLGLYNTYQRLLYFYGERSTIHVESTPGNGAFFTVHFPYVLEEVNPD